MIKMPTKQIPRDSEAARWAECIRNGGNTMVYITGDIHGSADHTRYIMDKTIKMSDTCSLHLQIDDEGRVYIARLIISGMPMQSRDNFGGMYPSSEEIRKGLYLYGYQFQEWADSNLDPDSLKKLETVGIYPETWFQDKILKPFYPEEYMG